MAIKIPLSYGVTNNTTGAWTSTGQNLSYQPITTTGTLVIPHAFPVPGDLDQNPYWSYRGRRIDVDPPPVPVSSSEREMLEGFGDLMERRIAERVASRRLEEAKAKGPIPPLSDLLKKLMKEDPASVLEEVFA